MKTQKLNLTFLTVAIAIFFLTNYLTVAQFGGGNGTVDNPYQIKTKAHLEELADSVNLDFLDCSKDKYFILMNDITDTVRTIIGYNNMYRGFCGNFDGQGFKIVLGINEQSDINVGLFGFIINCTISNLTVEGYVIGNIGPVGAIVGIASQAGSGETVIKNCVNNCTVIGKYGAGGIVGFGSNCKIENCINNGNIRNNINSMAYYHGFGGIIGGILGVQIENCINTGNVEGIYGVGGIIGNHIVSNEVDNNVNIRNCINSGFVKGEENVGGIIGILLFGKLENSINSGTVSGNSNLGCIVGEKSNSAIIENCFFDKQVCGE